MHTTQKSPEVRARARTAPNARTRRPRPDGTRPPHDSAPSSYSTVVHRRNESANPAQASAPVGPRLAPPVTRATLFFSLLLPSAATDKLRLLSPPSLPPSVASPSRTPDRPDPPLRFLPLFFSQGDCFSAHVHVSGVGEDSSITVGSPVGIAGATFGGVASPSRNINSSGRKTSVFDPDPDELARSQGRQHGSFNMLSVLAEQEEAGAAGPRSLRRDHHAPAGVAIQREDSGPLFSFNGGESKFTSNETNEMSYTWNPGGGLSALASERGGGGRSPDGSEDSSGEAAGTTRRRAPTSPGARRRSHDGSGRGVNTRGGSTHGVAGERTLHVPSHSIALPPRVVIVHVPNDDAEDACSAGRKQRGSFSSLLLLEAHNLSTMEFDGGSPGEEVALDHMPATRELEAGV